MHRLHITPQIRAFQASPNLISSGSPWYYRFRVKVQGPPFEGVPYPTNIIVNTAEHCEKPVSGFLDNYIKGYKGTAEIITTVPDDSCGRRKIQHTELIVNGVPTKPGDWPWHAAIYRLENSKFNYICGGTLLSKIFVVTGTSACNGDSGGGFSVFVPDDSGTTAPDASGAWYLRGIISLSVSRVNVPICDPYQYVIFIDVAKYKGWLDTNMK
ncbi:unnamed protein product [Chilo suppressalis]|uniref:Peptidase S1 domain-containing protein n=1 Tax=Chilo suppressalis TaxID=168631 RepID=A0ABN8B2N9_CHISP|nr:unnamed protein product [Chilo suppressalis]